MGILGTKYVTEVATKGDAINLATDTMAAIVEKIDPENEVFKNLVFDDLTGDRIKDLSYTDPETGEKKVFNIAEGNQFEILRDGRKTDPRPIEIPKPAEKE